MKIIGNKKISTSINTIINSNGKFLHLLQNVEKSRFQQIWLMMA